MGFKMHHSNILLAASLLTCTSAAALQVPFYGTSANGFTSPPRGWNSFPLQAASSTLKSGARWDFNDYHFRQQCDNLIPTPGFDYVCSIDSGWSVGCDGDDNGIPEPDTSIIPNITDLADHFHSKGLKLGLYILPGAFSSDSSKVVAGTSIQIGSLFDGSQPGYDCRETFDYTKDGVQQWHNSVVAKFASWFVLPF
jgi:alpha-galactosidase